MDNGVEKKYYTYILRCRDKTLYTGYSTDMERRVWEHNNSKRGAKYTKSRLPVYLEYYETFQDRSSAMKREYEIKRLSKEEKEKMIRGGVKNE